MGNGELSGDSPARPPPLIEVALYHLVLYDTSRLTFVNLRFATCFQNAITTICYLVYLLLQRPSLASTTVTKS